MPTTKIFTAVMIGTVLLASGCGGPAPEFQLQSARVSSSSLARTQVLSEFQPADLDGGSETSVPEVGIQRRIIYQAEIRLVVEDLEEIDAELPSLIAQHGGYLADASMDRTSGQQRTGRWQVRVPVEHFDAFLEAVSRLGLPETRRQTAQDVTEEYIDLEVRIASKKRLEERILKLVDEREGDIKELIEVERELSRVRTEIEQMEGRLRYLTNRTELTTVTVTAREHRGYIPPQAPTLMARVQQVWVDSVTLLRQIGERALLGIVFVVPWLPIAAVVLGIPLVWLRRRSSGA